MDNNLSKLKVEEMAGLKFKCSCGHTHSVQINNISVGCGVINKLPNIMDEFKGKKVFIISDVNTYDVAGKRVETLLGNGFKTEEYIFNDKHLVPDETALGKLMVAIPFDTALIVAVGSGTINDISRFLSYKFNIPYIIVGTAPSMDGYASVVSPLITDGVKTTYDAVYPYAIVADIDIMREAPMYMIQAGLGDILGKYTALADWHLAKLLKGEYFCDSIEELMIKAVDKCVKASPRIEDRDIEAVTSITEALILAGIAIGMAGASRPASGEEHHLSHCWEMIFMNRGEKVKWLHGNNVGVGVGIIAEAYKYLSKVDINEIYKSETYKHIDRNRWASNLTEVYSKSAENIIKFKESSIPFSEELRENNMQEILKKWKDIIELSETYVPNPDNIKNIMAEIGAIYSPKDLGIDRELFKKSFIAAKDIRKRYGILQLLEDIGMLEDAAEAIANIYYEE